MGLQACRAFLHICVYFADRWMAAMFGLRRGSLLTLRVVYRKPAEMAEMFTGNAGDEVLNLNTLGYNNTVGVGTAPESPLRLSRSHWSVMRGTGTDASPRSHPGAEEPTGPAPALRNT